MILAAINAWIAQGGKVAFLTLAMRHQWRQDLRHLWRAQSYA